MPSQFITPQATVVAFIAPPINFRIAVQEFSVFAVKRHSHAIVLAIYGREVADEHQYVFVIAGSAHEGNDAVIRIHEIYPLKAGVIEVDFV